MSKSSKTKLSDLHYISARNRSDSKLCQKVNTQSIGKNFMHKLLFGHVQILET